MKKPHSNTSGIFTSRVGLPCAVLSLFVPLLGSAHLGLGQEINKPQVYSAQATITTANCNITGGLCQDQNGPAPCNNGAGPNPVNLQATVTLCEIRGGGTLAVSGTGTGFQFGKIYVSLLYLNGNTATCSRFPAGVAPTLENLPQADSDFASMHLGFWVVKPDGSATLNVVKQGTVSGLNKYKTVSVREMQPPNISCFNSGLDPAPQLNALRACGPLTVVDGCSLGQSLGALCPCLQ